MHEQMRKDAYKYNVIANSDATALEIIQDMVANRYVSD